MVADALSRKTHPTDQCLAINAVVQAWFKEVPDSYDGDLTFSAILAALAVDSTSQQDYTISQRVLRYKGKICGG